MPTVDWSSSYRKEAGYWKERAHKAEAELKKLDGRIDTSEHKLALAQLKIKELKDELVRQGCETDDLQRELDQLRMWEEEGGA